MHYAPIVPIGYLENTQHSPMMMALTHLCKEPVYRDFYKRMSVEGHFIMLDNSIIELGKAVPADELIEAAQSIGAHEIVIPDSYQDAEGTIVLAEKYIPYLRKNYNGRLMGVAHGRTIMEWVACAKTLIKMRIDTLGVPKVMSDILGPQGRQQCIHALIEHKVDLSKIQIHFLGVWHDPLELGYYEMCREQNKTLPAIRSVDSVICYHYAKEGLLLEEDERPTTPIDFVDATYDTKVGARLLLNIVALRQLCRDNMQYDFTQSITPKEIEVETITDGNVTHVDFSGR